MISLRLSGSNGQLLLPASQARAHSPREDNADGQHRRGSCVQQGQDRMPDKARVPNPAVHPRQIQENDADNSRMICDPVAQHVVFPFD